MTENPEQDQISPEPDKRSGKKRRRRRGGSRRQKAGYHVDDDLGGVRHSGRSMHRYEALRRSQERVIVCVGAGILLGFFAGFIVGNFVVSIGTGLALGLACGILAAS